MQYAPYCFLRLVKELPEVITMLSQGLDVDIPLVSATFELEVAIFELDRLS